MKKTTLISAIIAFVSFVFFGVAMVFVKWDRTDADATSSALITSIIALAILTVAFGVFALLFDKKHKMLLIIPVIGLFVVNAVFTRDVIATQGLGGAASVFDILSPSANNPTILALLLAIAFITSVVFVLWKNYKWASIVSIAYTTILVVTTFSIIANILFTEKNLLNILSSTGLLLALAAMIVYFVQPFVSNNEIVAKPKPEKVVEEKAEEAEAPAEENNEETPAAEENNDEAKDEAPVEEKDEEKSSDEAKEETPATVEEKAEDNKEAEDEKPAEENKDEEKKEDWNPFKNQYSSSSTVFDIQDEDENK